MQLTLCCKRAKSYPGRSGALPVSHTIESNMTGVCTWATFRQNEPRQWHFRDCLAWVGVDHSRSRRERALASCSCFNESPQTGSLKNNRNKFSHSSRDRRPHLRCQQGRDRSRGSGKEFFPLPSSPGPRHPVAGDCKAPISASVFTWPPSCASVSLFL